MDCEVDSDNPEEGVDNDGCVSYFGTGIVAFIPTLLDKFGSAFGQVFGGLGGAYVAV